jgi:hypothetical protein
MQLALGAIDGEIRDTDHMHAARAVRLRQEHGAELSRADQANRHRPAGGLTLEQLGMEIHGRRPSFCAPLARQRQHDITAAPVETSHARAGEPGHRRCCATAGSRQQDQWQTALVM